MADEPEPKPIRMTPELLRRALDMQRRGMTQATIADRLGLSRRTIQKYLATVNAKAFKRIAGEAEAILARQVAILEWCAQEAGEAWLRSKKATITKKTGPDGTEVTIKTGSGDASKLREVREALAGIRQVLKLDDRPAEVISDDYVIDLSDDDSIVFPDDGTDGPVTYTVGEVRRTDGAPIRANIDRPMTLAQAKAAGIHIPGVTDPPPPAIEGKKSDPEHAAYLDREAERDRERQMNQDELALTKWADRRLG